MAAEAVTQWSAPRGTDSSSRAPPPAPPAWRRRLRRQGEAGRHPPRCRAGARGQRAGSRRLPKDPSSFRSMDELRQSLERESEPGLVTGTLRWLGALVASSWYSWLLRPLGPASSRDSAAQMRRIEAEADPTAVTQLQALLLGSRTSTLKLIASHPQILEMDRQEVLQRIVGLKGLFPGSDVARMIALQPALFLDGEWAPKQVQLAEASSLLRRELQGADCDFMFQEDAAILFVPVPALKAGLEQMRELWPQLTPAALEASSPLHLSLAIQALGPLGPPKGF